MSAARANLAKFSEMQNSKANVDAWGVFLILVPVSKLSGDSEFFKKAVLNFSLNALYLKTVNLSFLLNHGMTSVS
jgi:hypothetical protein